MFRLGASSIGMGGLERGMEEGIERMGGLERGMEEGIERMGGGNT